MRKVATRCAGLFGVGTFAEHSYFALTESSEETDMATRCRLCTTNDQVQLIEQLAADLWGSRRHGTLDDRPWLKAGDYWQRVFRDFAATALDSLHGDPPYGHAAID